MRLSDAARKVASASDAARKVASADARPSAPVQLPASPATPALRTPRSAASSSPSTPAGSGSWSERLSALERTQRKVVEQASMAAEAVSANAADVQALQQQASEFGAFQREASIAHAEIGRLRQEMDKMRVSMQDADERALRAEASLSKTRAELAELTVRHDTTHQPFPTSILKPEPNPNHQVRHYNMHQEWQTTVEAQRTAASKASTLQFTHPRAQLLDVTLTIALALIPTLIPIQVAALDTSISTLGERLDSLEQEVKVKLPYPNPDLKPRAWKPRHSRILALSLPLARPHPHPHPRPHPRARPGGYVSAGWRAVGHL